MVRLWDGADVDELLTAFWRYVRHDLRAGRPEVLAWLDSDDATWWLRVSFPSRDVDQVRAWLRQLWRPRERAA